MIETFVARILAVILSFLVSITSTSNSYAIEWVAIIPARPQYAPKTDPRYAFMSERVDPRVAFMCMNEAETVEISTEDRLYVDAYVSATHEFDTLFNSYDVKRAKNGAMMIRKGDSGSYKFCKKG